MVNFHHHCIYHVTAVLQLCAEMKVAIMTGLPAKRDMDIQSEHETKVSHLAYFCGMMPSAMPAFFLRRLGIVWVMFSLWIVAVAQTPGEGVSAEETLKAQIKAQKAAEKAYRERLKRPINGYIFEPDSFQERPDSLALVRFTRGVHFADSLTSGKFDSVIASITSIHHGTKVSYNYRDPFDPYNNPTYYRRGQGKFWYFGLGMCLLLVFMYFRAAFPKQFELRIRGVLNPYYYNELMNDKTITQFGGGSGVVFVFTQAVFAAGILLNLIEGGYLQLNNFFVFVFLYLGVLGAVVLQQTIQFLFANSVHIEELVRRQTQRQYNVNFLLSLICFPLFLVLYYNGYKYHELNLTHWISFILILWVVIRSIYAFVGLFQDGQLTFLAFLYFCTLEILPYSVLFAILSRS